MRDSVIWTPKDISGFNADMKAATAVHDKEHGDFLVKEKDH